MKTCRNKKLAGKQGGALLMAMLVMLAITILAMGLYKMHETASVEAIYLEQKRQAFWVAESGLADGEFIVQYSQTFRDDPSSFAIPQGITNEAVGGYYDLTIIRDIIDETAGIYDFEITSVGYVNGFNRRLRKTYRASPGSRYAIIGISGHSELSSNVEVKGPIAQIAGTVDVHDSRGLDDYIIMGDGEGALTDKKGVAVIANIPPPPVPTIDSTEYMGWLDDALAEAETTDNITNTASTVSGTLLFNFASPTNMLVFNSKVKVADDTVIVVAKGNIRFNKSGASIGERVKIISGNDISFKVQTKIAGGAELFAVNNIHFEAGSELFSSEPIILMALNGDIIMDSNFEFMGIVISGAGKVELNANGDIAGTVIGGVGVDADANITITYDERVFTEGTPVNPKSLGDVILTGGVWEELSPL